MGTLDCIELAELGFCFTRFCPLRQNAVCQREAASWNPLGRQLYNVRCSSDVRKGAKWTAGRTAQTGASTGEFRPEIRMQKTTSPSRSVGYLEEAENSEGSDSGSTRGGRQRAAKRGAHSGAREAYKTRMTAALDAELVRKLFYLELVSFSM
jgi:hypothetical protein